MGELEPGELRLMAADVALQPLDVRAKGAQPGVIGADLRGLERARRVGVRRLRRGPPAARPALERLELVSERLVAAQLVDECLR